MFSLFWLRFHDSVRCADMHKVGPMLTRNEQRDLLLRARRAIAGALKMTLPPAVPFEYPLLDTSVGVFVTLHRRGKLRGCIGYIEGRGTPLRKLIIEAAEMAAFQDPRFPSVGPDEVDSLNIEISILTPPEPCLQPSEIVIGTHGLILECNGSRGLLLPQVAEEYGWGAVEFLNHTARKAGLPASSWQRQDARIWKFSAEVFSEEIVMREEPSA
jgi:AmmeMemoRadiSam system protein A